MIREKPFSLNPLPGFKIPFSHSANDQAYLPGRPIILFVPHRDEVSALIAAQSLLQKHRGRLLAIQGPPFGRNLVFPYNRRLIRLDPNRIFSDRGIGKNLSDLNPKLPPTTIDELLERLSGLAENIFQIIIGKEPDPFVIAVHTNSYGNGYHVSLYQNDRSKEHREYLLLGKKNPTVHSSLSRDDFILTTIPDLFQRIGASCNVVLQTNMVIPAIDDGSLSIRCAQSGIHYINVEVGAPKCQANLIAVKKLSELLDRVTAWRQDYQKF